MRNNTWVGATIWCAGWVVIVVGLVFGLGMGQEMNPSTFSYHTNWSLVVLYWLLSIVLGLFLLGISEIICILNKQKSI